MRYVEIGKKVGERVIIDTELVRRLVESQFPKWKDLPVQAVTPSGWDNRSFRLGEDMLVRMPSAKEYASQVEKEHKWLPKLAPFLPVSIPSPLAMGEPAFGYPWKWSVYQWLKGETAASAYIDDLSLFAKSLAEFLIALERIDTRGGPLPGPHSFYRGGALITYDTETRQSIALLKDKIDANLAIDLWETALKTAWKGPLVWVHGDISAGNLLLEEGRLSAVIDFGQLTVGDPACDLAIACTLFQGESREVFQKALPFDDGTWARARAWTLWKALIVGAGFTNPNNKESRECLRIIDEVLIEHEK